jgi:hypothetical protein
MAKSTSPVSPRRLLWVEGKDDDAVVQSLCKKNGVPHVFTVQEKGGLPKLLHGVPVELRARALEAFGVVVDADESAHSRWTQIRGIAEGEGYAGLADAPPHGGLIVPAQGDLPRFGVWIMPDNAAPGALEEFATLLVPEHDALLQLAGDVVDAIPAELQKFSPIHRQKAVVRTWLAWQESPGSPMGQAIGKGDLRADAPAAQRFVACLRRLMVDEMG